MSGEAFLSDGAQVEPPAITVENMGEGGAMNVKFNLKVAPCRLTASTTMLKAPMVPALEATIS
jgi:hypothetical protein